MMPSSGRGVIVHHTAERDNSLSCNNNIHNGTDFAKNMLLKMSFLKCCSWYSFYLYAGRKPVASQTDKQHTAHAKSNFTTCTEETAPKNTAPAFQCE